MRLGFVVLHARSATRLGFSPLSGHGLDPGIEARIAQRLILVERQTDVVDRLVVQLCPEQFTVCRLPFLVIPPQRQVERVRR